MKESKIELLQQKIQNIKSVINFSKEIDIVIDCSWKEMMKKMPLC